MHRVSPPPAGTRLVARATRRARRCSASPCGRCGCAPYRGDVSAAYLAASAPIIAAMQRADPDFVYRGEGRARINDVAAYQISFQTKRGGHTVLGRRYLAVPEPPESGPPPVRGRRHRAARAALAGRPQRRQRRLQRAAQVAAAVLPVRHGAPVSGRQPARPLAWAEFERVDMRVGRIVAVEEFPEARRPAWKLRVDFGPEIGLRRSLRADHELPPRAARGPPGGSASSTSRRSRSAPCARSAWCSARTPTARCCCSSPEPRRAARRPRGLRRSRGATARRAAPAAWRRRRRRGGCGRGGVRRGGAARGAAAGGRGRRGGGRAGGGGSPAGRSAGRRRGGRRRVDRRRGAARTWASPAPWRRACPGSVAVSEPVSARGGGVGQDLGLAGGRGLRCAGEDLGARRAVLAHGARDGGDRARCPCRRPSSGGRRRRPWPSRARPTGGGGLRRRGDDAAARARRDGLRGGGRLRRRRACAWRGGGGCGRPRRRRR